MPKPLRQILVEASEKMPKHPSQKNAWVIKTKEQFDAVKPHTVNATLYQMTSNRFGRTAVRGPAGWRIEKEKGLLKKHVSHLLG